MGKNNKKGIKMLEMTKKIIIKRHPSGKGETSFLPCCVGGCSHQAGSCGSGCPSLPQGTGSQQWEHVHGGTRFQGWLLLGL